MRSRRPFTETDHAQRRTVQCRTQSKRSPRVCPKRSPRCCPRARIGRAGLRRSSKPRSGALELVPRQDFDRQRATTRTADARRRAARGAHQRAGTRPNRTEQSPSCRALERVAVIVARGARHRRTGSGHRDPTVRRSTGFRDGRVARDRGPRSARTRERRHSGQPLRVSERQDHRQPRARRTCRRKAGASTSASRSAFSRTPVNCRQRVSAVSRSSANSGLYGEIRPVRGALSAAIAAGKAGRGIIVPLQNRQEAALAHGRRRARGAASRRSVRAAELAGQRDRHIDRARRCTCRRRTLELADVKGQLAAKRALEIAAAGAHHLLLIGPPGTGKTMLAERLNSLLPPLDENDALEVVRIHSARGSFDPQFLHGARPMRAPHHTASAAAMVGGGARIPRPGEISLAHRGVLFLDELPEFDRRVLESLRQPLESGAIELSRAQVSVCYPARFQLVAAMNPCPAGRTCTHVGLHLHARAAEPLSQPRVRTGARPDRLARLGARGGQRRAVRSVVEVRPIPNDIRARIEAARRTQLARAGKLNSALTAPEVDAYCELDVASRRLRRARDGTVGVVGARRSPRAEGRAHPRGSGWRGPHCADHI